MLRVRFFSPVSDREIYLSRNLVLQSLISANIDVILGERLDLDSIGEEPKTNALGQRIVRTVKGRVIAADMIVSLSASPTFCRS